MVERDDYGYWEKAITTGKFDPVHEGEPQAGFYRMKKHKGGPWLPVAIWRNKKGEMVARVDNKKIDDVGDIWIWACRHPVTKVEYDKVVGGADWSDMDPAVADSLKPVDRHHNEPPDELRILDDQIESALAGLASHAKITSREQLAQAQGLRSRLNELAATADKNREAEKAPHLAAGKVVDKKWMPLVNKAKDGGSVLKKPMKEFLETELEAEKTIASASPAEQEASPPLSTPSTKFKGAYGRMGTGEVRNVIAGITEIDELFHWPPMHNHPELREEMHRLAQKALDKGLNPPGCRIEKEVKIR